MTGAIFTQDVRFSYVVIGLLLFLSSEDESGISRELVLWLSSLYQPHSPLRSLWVYAILQPSTNKLQSNFEPRIVYLSSMEIIKSKGRERQAEMFAAGARARTRRGYSEQSAALGVDDLPEDFQGPEEVAQASTSRSASGVERTDQVGGEPSNSVSVHPFTATSSQPSQQEPANIPAQTQILDDETQARIDDCLRVPRISNFSDGSKVRAKKSCTPVPGTSYMTFQKGEVFSVIHADDWGKYIAASGRVYRV